MKKSLKSLVLLLALGAIQEPFSAARAQGSLTPPPGAPAPVMKSLDQIEARTPLVAGAPGVSRVNGLYTISQSGSYYLTGNIVCTNSGGTLIQFTASNITLDLNGFSLIGTNGNLGNAISGSGFGYRVFNGHIVGGTTQINGVFSPVGFYDAVSLFSGNVSVGTDSLVENITVRGMRNRGIQASLNSIVRNCAVDTTVGYGIGAGSVSDCQAINTGDDAIQAGRVLNCYGKSVGDGDGIGYYNTQFSTVQNSTGEAVSGIGVRADTVLNSYGKSVSGIGILATIANSCIGNRAGGTAISANIGIGCYAEAGTNSITHKYNMP